MLNELYQLAEALEKQNVMQSVNHPDINPPSACEAIIFFLKEDGSLGSLERSDKKKTETYWRHSKGNHHSFPAVRVQKPLLSKEQSRCLIEFNWEKAKEEEKRKLLLNLNYNDRNTESSDFILNSWTLEKLGCIRRSDDSNLAALKSLLECYPKNLEEQDQFYRNILLGIKRELPALDKRTCDLLKDILLGKYDKKRDKFVSSTMTYFDMWDFDEYECGVGSAECRQALVRELIRSGRDSRNSMDSMDSDTSEEEDRETDVCSLSGERCIPEDDKYPNPKLPILGNVTLYSNNKVIPCLNRYGRNGAAAFQAGRKQISKMNNALLWITQKENEHKTWRSISGNKADKPALLIAYVENSPDNNAHLAELFSDTLDIVTMQDYYPSVCNEVVGTLQDVKNRFASKEQTVKIKLIILEALDKGRTQIVLSEQYDADDVIGQTQLWQAANRNKPEISGRYYDWKKDEKSGGNGFYSCPGVGRISVFFKHVYTLETANGKTDIKQMDRKLTNENLEELYRLFIPHGIVECTEEFLIRMLEKALRHSEKLICFATFLSERDEKYRPDKETESDLYTAVSVLSIILYKLGIRKENYMFDAPFYFGQLLQLCDLLQIQYSLDVRSKEDKTKTVPSQLVGNSILLDCAERPIESLERIMERCRIYFGWAVSIMDEAKDGKKLYRCIQKTASAIAERDLPEEFTGEQKAQMFLGYISDTKWEKEN